MASVVPTSGPQASFTGVSPLISSWEVWSRKLLRTWQQMQVSYYGGKYSIHRVLAFEEYVNNTSPSRVAMVCTWTPLPMVVLVFGQESIPLQEIDEGWSVNYGLWIRAVILIGIVTYGVVVQGIYLIDDFTVTARQMFLLVTSVPIAVVGFSMVMAAFVVFPIPFYAILMIPEFFLALFLALRVIMGPQVIQQMIDHSDQVAHCLRFICAQTSTLFIFPCYEMLFRAAEGTQYQMLVILFLPLIKLATKNIILHFAKSLEDMIPVEVIFTADFFNAVYVATCMQSATSVAAVTAITVTDLSQTISMVYGLQRRTTSILSNLRHTVDSSADKDNMLTMLCWLCRHPECFQRQAHSGIRKRSCLPHQLSVVNKRVLESLNSIVIDQDRILSGPKMPDTLSKVYFLGVRNPFKTPHSISPSDKIQPTQSRQHSRSHRPRILLEAFETLFTTECLIVTAYLEAFMPLFYCSYMMVMVNLQSAQYHTEMKGITRDNVVATILPLFVFGLLQIASFVLLVVMIKRNCGMQAIYQLAFVLESQRSLVQCKMMLWMVVTLCFRVKHFGTFVLGYFNSKIIELIPIFLQE
ncbi:hypothetical protein P3T76_005429 [Phytophthora citrophthora]|uniref:Transmembrane protein n=1 Tax=Phytophthora citrophthora TaxID=4793 RepID=A0AAD9GQD0_9STRA|nr:hypothetical protein P3T76_005429 [Phytophthora citrophthora]